MPTSEELIKKYGNKTSPTTSGVTSSDKLLEKYGKTTQSNALTSVLGANAVHVPQTIDDARVLQEKDPSLWSKISKELMKPVGVVSTMTKGTGDAIGSLAVGDIKGAGKELINIPGKIGGIITGTRTQSFSDIYNEAADNGIIDKKIAFWAGLATDIAADPINIIGGGLTKVGTITNKLQKLEKAGETLKVGSKIYKEAKALNLIDDTGKLNTLLATSKAEQVQAGQRALLTVMAGTRWEKKIAGGARIYEVTEPLGKGIANSTLVKKVRDVFSTKTGDDAFNVTKAHFDNLKEYRQGKVMQEAIEIQRHIGKLSQEDAKRIIDLIETAGGKSIKVTDDTSAVAFRLQENLKGLATQETGAGLLKTQLQDYFPHRLVSGTKDTRSSWQKTKDLFKNADGAIPEGGESPKIFVNAKEYSTKLDSSKQRKISGTISEIKKELGIDFNDNAAIAYAQRALGSAKAVTSKEFFESSRQFGKAVADATPETANWVAVKGIDELEGLKFAPDVATQISSYKEAIRPESIKKMLYVYDSVQNWWKAQALVAPGYHTRNMVGNMWNNFIGGITDPRAYIDAGKIQTGKSVSFIDDAGRKWDTPAIMEAAKKSGVIGEGWYAKDIEIALTSEIGGASWNPLKQNFGLFKANRAVGSAFENNSRLAHFIQKIKEGNSIDDAAISVKKYLFDYGDLTFTEKEVFKRVMPFYTWTRKNVPLQIEQIFKQPAKYAAIPKVTDAIEGRVEKPDEKYLGAYIKDNVGVRVGSDDKGNTFYFLMGNWLPAAQAIDFISQPMENFIMSVTPFAKVPFETWANQSFFFEDTFGKPSQIERYPEENTSFFGLTMRKKTANILKNIRILNELDKLNPGLIFGDKNTPSLANRIAPEAGFRAPFGIGTITTSEKKGGKYTTEISGGDRALQSLFGKMIPYNPTTARKYYMWDTDTKIRELERAIKDARRDGQDEYAKRMIEQLKKVKKERR